MTQLFLQPGVDKPAPDNFEKSIAQAVDLATLPLDAMARAELGTLFPNGKAWVWGVPKDLFWKLMERGDVVLFLTGPNGLVKYTGVVAATLESEAIAREIWGDSCAHFRHIYFLTQVRVVDLKRADINKTLGYDAEGYNWQSFSIVRRPEGVATMLAQLGASTPLPTYRDEYPDFDESDGEDGLRLASYRKEQTKLKNALFAGRIAMHCAVCGDLHPRKFLFASHLQKRSKCTKKQRVNQLVVLPMCTFGCDALYEHGYLTLDWKSGQVVPTKKTALLEGTKAGELVHRLVGKQSHYPMESHKEFLGWHHMEFGVEGAPT